MIDALIGFLLALALLGILYLFSLRGRWRTPDWLVRLSGGVPWAPGVARTMVAVPNEGRQPTHEVYFVARQDIAECGVVCPKCSHDVAERGDFTRVMRAVIDGQENEVLKCPGLIDMSDGQKPRPCPAWIAAAPNTEHGDDLIDGDPAEFYQFTRITQQQALAEKYGVEIKPGIDGLVADPKQRPAAATFASAVPFTQASFAEGVAHEAALRQRPAGFEIVEDEDDEERRVAARRAPHDDDTRILPILPTPKE